MRSFVMNSPQDPQNAGQMGECDMERVDHVMDRFMTVAVFCVPLYMIFKLGLFLVD